MNTKTLGKAEISGSNLDTVRQRAKKQSIVKLPRSNGQECRTSLRGIKSLKSKSADDCCPAKLLDGNLIDRTWDWFQRAIGNR